MGTCRGGAKRRARGLALFAVLVVGVSAAPVIAATPTEEVPQPSVQEAANLPNGAQVAEGLRKAEEQEEEEERRRESPQAEAEREESRNAYSASPPAEAEALLESQFASQLAAIDRDPARMLTDAKLKQVLGSTGASISVNGQTMLMDGTFPVRVLNEEGDLAKVSLALQHEDGQFVPANPFTQMALPELASEGIDLGETDLSITPDLKGESSGRPLGDKDIFYPEVDTDTDLIAMPIGEGVELFSQLRSVQSPEDFRFKMDLPPGSELTSDGEGGAKVSLEGTPIASIPAPTATDAQGATVAVSMKVDDDSLVVEINHRNMDVAYPLLVDPAIVDEWYGAKSWYAGGSLAALSDGTWAYSSSDWGRFVPGTSPIYATFGGSNRGLFISAKSIAENQWAGRYGQWSYTVPGSTTYIAAAGSYPDSRNDHGCAAGYYPEPHDYDGLWSPAWSPQYGWIQFQSNAAWAYGQSFSEPPNDWRRITAQLYILGLGTGTSATAPNPCWRDLYIGGAYVWMDDPDQPTLSTVSSGQWTDKSPVRLNVSATDPGLGVKSFTSTAKNMSGSTQSWSTVNSCTGLRASPCPGSWDLSKSGPSLIYEPAVLPEGIGTLDVTAYDAVGHQSTGTNTMTVRIDHDLPSIALSGTLTEQAKLGTELPEYKILAVASDGVPNGTDSQQRSGVSQLAFKVDGKQIDAVPAVPGCATQSCGVKLEYKAISSGLSIGSHTFQAAATDNLGHLSEKSVPFTITRDQTAPTVSLSGALGTGTAPVGSETTLTMTAKDGGSGVLTATVSLDGAVIDKVTQTCPQGGCELVKARTENLSGAKSGVHSLEVAIADGVGNIRKVVRSIYLDLTPPSIQLSGTLINAEASPLTERFYGLNVAASDSAVTSGHPGAGVVGITIEIDGQQVAKWPGECSSGCAAALTNSYALDRNAWPASHTAYVIATDSLGNGSAKVVGINYPVEVNSEAKCPAPVEGGVVTGPVSAAAAVNEVKSSAANLVAPSKPATYEGTGQVLDPSLAPTEPQIGITGTVPGGSTSKDPAIGLSAGICMVPAGVSKSAIDGTVVNEDAVVYANTAQDADTIVRPTAFGASIVQQLRSTKAPSQYSWELGLTGNQKLELLPNGSVAIVEPEAEIKGYDPSKSKGSESGEQGSKQELPNPLAGANELEGAPSVADQIEEGEWEIVAAQELVADGMEVVTVVTAPWVRVSAEQTIPAYLTVKEDIITLHIENLARLEQGAEAEEDPDFAGISMVNSRGTQIVQGCLSRAHVPYVHNAVYWTGRKFKAISWGAGMNCNQVQWMKITVAGQEEHSILFVDYWETYVGNQREQNHEGGLKILDGAECGSSKGSVHSFRTAIFGNALATVGSNCWNSNSGNCQISVSDYSDTRRFQCVGH